MARIFSFAVLAFSMLMGKPWTVRGWEDFLLFMTDGLFVGGALLLCVGGLCYAWKNGGFDMLGYTLSSAVKKDKGESYYSYVAGKRAVRKWLSPVRDGAVMVGLSAILAIMWQIFVS